MSESISVSLKALLGEKVYLDYLRKFVFPSIHKLTDQGKINEFELAKISYNIKNEGIDVLSPEAYFRSDITRNTFHEAGWIAEVIHPLTNNVKIHAIIKKARPQEDIINELTTHNSLIKLLEYTDYSGKIPDSIFANKKKNIVATTFIEGELLEKKLKNTKDKTSILKPIIDDYLNFQKILNDEKDLIKTSSELIRFDKFFQTKYLRGNTPIETELKILEVYNREIGEELTHVSKEFIQGDLNPLNILINGNTKYLDWANAAKNGFVEFDLGTLLKKSNISIDEENNIVRYAASKRFKSMEEQEKSLRLYTKNMITQELVAAARYTQRASHAKGELAKSLENMALFNFNKALKRMEYAENKGFISSKFREAIEKTAPTSLRRVVNFEDLSKTDNPDEMGSQYNLIPKNLSETDAFNIDNNLASIDKNIKKANLWYNIKLAVFPFIGLGLGALTYFGYHATFDSGKEAERQEMILQQTNSDNSSSFHRMYSRAFETTAMKILEGKEKTFTLRDSAFERIAAKYDVLGKIKEFDPEALTKYEAFTNYKLNGAGFLKHITRINKIFAGVHNSERHTDTNPEGLTIFDPQLISTIPEGSQVTNMEQNLEEGVKKLLWHLEKYKDLKLAIYDNIYPVELNTDTYRGSSDLVWAYGTISDEEEMNSVKELAAQMTYNILKGSAKYAWDGGVKSVFLSATPDNYIEDWKYARLKDTPFFDPVTDTISTVQNSPTSGNDLLRTVSGRWFYGSSEYKEYLTEIIRKGIEKSGQTQFVIEAKNTSMGLAGELTTVTKADGKIYYYLNGAEDSPPEYSDKYSVYKLDEGVLVEYDPSKEEKHRFSIITKERIPESLLK